MKQKNKGRPAAHAKAPRTAEQYFAKPNRQRASLVKSAHVLTAMRSHNLSLNEAAREVGIRPETVRRYAGSALHKNKRGKYKVRRSDTMLRPLVIPAAGGLLEIITRDSRSASLASRYADAVKTFLDTGDESELREFRGQHLTDVNGTAVPLLTDLDELERLGAAGVLSFESLYAKVG